MLSQDSLKFADIRNYVLERFEDVKTNPSMNKLVKFHTFNKFLFMACSQIELNKLGKIVANQEKLQTKDVLDSYEKHLKNILSKTPTRSRHANVLRRMYGHFNKKIPKSEQKTIEHLISEYQNNNITLSDMLYKLRTITSDIDNMYVVKQSYFLLFADKI
ncbi:DUF1722 domain-containing protein [Nitrosopumilus piranensis]|uniref:DUF1722 domain-containing protein n=1 Tax=Nitrosopumilus piranensis TaxID=1582439 RepID=A0A0C5BXR9_9ARCH|nr:DUF1722 domain-containing protein [Nitrosopumilus piranensis]AJM91775.1 hypothetical protein NPIRD3C_0561 [Nitrosopumilus piranensis]